MKADLPTLQHWPRMAQAVNEAAAQLHPQYGVGGIPSDVLMREIERGAWLGIRDPLDEDVADVNRYRGDLPH